MAKNTVNFIKLGFLVTAGVLIFIVGLYFIGSEKNIFGNTYRITAEFRDVNGLRPGNNVRFGGIDVGSVEKITIRNDSVISVVLVIDEKLKSVIRKNSVAAIGTDGLMGDKLVNITGGSSDSSPLEEGDVISSAPVVNTEEMLRTLEFTNQNVAIVSANLKRLTETINESRGTLYTMLLDTSLAPHLHASLHNIETASRHLNLLAVTLSDAARDLNEGKGFLGTLIKDTVIQSDLIFTMKKIREGSEQLTDATASLKETAQKLNSGDGTLSALINDTTMAAQFRRTMQNIDSGAVRLNENLEALKHSAFLRKYFRNNNK